MNALVIALPADAVGLWIVASVSGGKDSTALILAWTEAEDKFLFRRLRELEGEGDEAPTKTIAKEIQRSRMAVETRLQSLRAGIRLAWSKR